MTQADPVKKAKQVKHYRASIMARRALRNWYKTPLGIALGNQESQALENILPNLFGYHLLQLSEHRESSYLNKSLIRHKIISDIDDVNLSGYLNLQMNPQLLPFAEDSVDVVVLQHTLDVDMAPHQVLRETDRVLVPEGRVIILGFNPWSMWGCRHMINVWHGECPWNLRFLSPHRIKDWLVLLGFEIESVSTFFFRPPLSSQMVANKTRFLDKLGTKAWPAFGGAYLLVARKQVSTLTPIRPRWYLRRRSRVSPGFIETREKGSS